MPRDPKRSGIITCPRLVVPRERSRIRVLAASRTFRREDATRRTSSVSRRRPSRPPVCQRGGSVRSATFQLQEDRHRRVVTAPQKSASLGLAQTIEAMMLFDIVQTHDSPGATSRSRTAPLISHRSSAGTDVQVHPEHVDAAATNRTQVRRFVCTALRLTVKRGDFRIVRAGAAGRWRSLAQPAAEQQRGRPPHRANGRSSTSGHTKAQFDAYDFYAAAPDSLNGLTQATNTTLCAHVLPADATKADGTPDSRQHGEDSYGFSRQATRGRRIHERLDARSASG